MDEMENKDLQQETPEQEALEQEVSQEEILQEEKEVYVPRPAWQVWGARIALVVFILFLIMYYINILRGNG